MIFKLDGQLISTQGGVVSLRCPACGKRGSFEPIRSEIQDVHLNTPQGEVRIFGQRRCPDKACRAHVFFVTDAKRVLASYPAQRIDFDPTSLPGPVLKAFEEAVTCHANECFIGAGMLVRKTLEELCHNRGATGENLKARIRALEDKVVLPKELFDGLDDLRVLGNDAAHIESQDYNDVGREEVETAIEFAKEVLKAVYQYTALLDRLRKLKKQP